MLDPRAIFGSGHKHRATNARGRARRSFYRLSTKHGPLVTCDAVNMGSGRIFLLRVHDGPRWPCWCRVQTRGELPYEEYTRGQLRQSATNESPAWRKSHVHGEYRHSEAKVEKTQFPHGILWPGAVDFISRGSESTRCAGVNDQGTLFLVSVHEACFQDGVPSASRWSSRPGSPPPMTRET